MKPGKKLIFFVAIFFSSIIVADNKSNSNDVTKNDIVKNKYQALSDNLKSLIDQKYFIIERNKLLDDKFYELDAFSIKINEAINSYKNLKDNVDFQGESNDIVNKIITLVDDNEYLKKNVAHYADIKTDTSAKRKIEATRFFGNNGEPLSTVIIQPAALYSKVEFKDDNTNKLFAVGYEFLVATATIDNQLKRQRAFALEGKNYNSANAYDCPHVDEHKGCTTKQLLLDSIAAVGFNLIVDSNDNTRTYYEYNCKYENNDRQKLGLLTEKSLLNCKYVSNLTLPDRFLVGPHDENSSDLVSIFSYFSYMKKYHSVPDIDSFDDPVGATYYMNGRNFTTKEYNQKVKLILSLDPDSDWQPKYIEVNQKLYEDKRQNLELDLTASRESLQKCTKRIEENKERNNELVEEIKDLKKQLETCR